MVISADSSRFSLGAGVLERFECKQHKKWIGKFQIGTVKI